MYGRILMLGIVTTWLAGCTARSLIFHPGVWPSGNWEPANLDFEDVWFDSADGVKLHGWYVPAAQPSGYLLYAHGNAGNLSDRAAVIRLLNHELGLSVFIFDYRGYGRSQGRPSVNGIRADGKAAMNWLRSRAGIGSNDIILLGSSLGGLVAVHLAAEEGARALILEGAFPSLARVARSRFPWLPVGPLLRQDINAGELIRGFRGPVFQSHAGQDSIIPIALGRSLFEAANDPKEFMVLPARDHNDARPAEYYRRLGRFLQSAATTDK